MSSQKKSSRLEGKDLITIGIYTVIYVVIVMLVAMLGFIPVFIPLMAVLCPLIGGIPYMLYLWKNCPRQMWPSLQFTIVTHGSIRLFPWEMLLC